MRRFFAVIALFVLAAMVAAAQGTPKFEAFAGYMFLRNFTEGVFDPILGPGTGLLVRDFSYNGGTAQFAYNPTKWIGAVADFGVVTKSDIARGAFALPFDPDRGFEARLSTFLFGPRVTFATHRLKPYAQTLFGVARQRVKTDILAVPVFPDDVILDPDDALSFEVRDHRNVFAMALGGGLDVRVWKQIYVRPIAVDYLMTRTESRNFHHLRYTAGVNFTWGAR